MMNSDKCIAENNGEELYQTPEDTFYRTTKGGARQSLSALEALTFVTNGGDEEAQQVIRLVKAMDSLQAGIRR
jgi:hypothetical protein